MKVTPSLGKGVAVLLGYLAVVFTVWLVTGVDYDTIGDSIGGVRDAVVLAMAAGLVYLVIVVSVLGWWTPAMREPRRAHHVWMWSIPVLLLIGVVINLASTKWDRVDDLGAYLAWLVIGCVRSVSTRRWSPAVS